LSKRVYKGVQAKGDLGSVLGEPVPQEEVRIRTNPRAKAAYESERKRGYDEGYEAGLQQGRDEALHVETQLRQVQTGRFAEDLAAVAQRIDHGIEQYWLAAQHELRSLAVAIAVKLLKRELSQNPDAITSVVRDALLRIANSREVRIRISTSDLPAARAHHDELAAAVEGIAHVEWLPSNEMLPGGCLIESNTGVVDATVESQREQLADAMRREAA
jgi:flagellar assembly protein FliH